MPNQQSARRLARHRFALLRADGKQGPVEEMLADHFNAEIRLIRQSLNPAQKARHFSLERVEEAWRIWQENHDKQAAPQANRPGTNPEVVHIVGTNGKGSTAWYLSQFLRRRGLRTGLFSSPHLITLRERFRVNGRPISSRRLAAAYRELSALIPANLFRDLSFFDLTFLMAMVVFHRGNCDIILLEAGLGGRLDSTRVAGGRWVVLTPIGLEHTRLLGNNIEEILTEKLAIGRPGRTRAVYQLLVPPQNRELTRRIFGKMFGGPSKPAPDPTGNPARALEGLPPHLTQWLHKPVRFSRNALLAKLVAGRISKERPVPANKVNYQQPFRRLTGFPGRLEFWYHPDVNATIVFDSLHNLHALRWSFRRIMEYNERENKNAVPMVIRLAFQEDKNPRAIRRFLRARQARGLNYQVKQLPPNNGETTLSLSEFFPDDWWSRLSALPEGSLLLVGGSTRLYRPFLEGLLAQPDLPPENWQLTTPLV